MVSSNNIYSYSTASQSDYKLVYAIRYHMVIYQLYSPFTLAYHFLSISVVIQSTASAYYYNSRHDKATRAVVTSILNPGLLAYIIKISYFINI
jgi:hypothetical protein